MKFLNESNCGLLLKCSGSVNTLQQTPASAQADSALVFNSGIDPNEILTYVFCGLAFILLILSAWSDRRLPSSARRGNFHLKHSKAHLSQKSLHFDASDAQGSEAGDKPVHMEEALQGKSLVGSDSLDLEKPCSASEASCCHFFKLIFNAWQDCLTLLKHVITQQLVFLWHLEMH